QAQLVTRVDKEIEAGYEIGTTRDDGHAQFFLDAKNLALGLSEIAPLEGPKHAVGQAAERIAAFTLAVLNRFGLVGVPAFLEDGQERVEIGRRFASQELFKVILGGPVQGRAEHQAGRDGWFRQTENVAKEKPQRAALKQPDGTITQVVE